MAAATCGWAMDWGWCMPVQWVGSSRWPPPPVAPVALVVDSTGQFPLVAQPIAVAHARTGLAKVSPPCIPRPPRVPCLAWPCLALRVPVVPWQGGALPDVRCCALLQDGSRPARYYRCYRYYHSVGH